MKFLVVDDSATMRRIVINSLQRIGFSDTVEAGDGQEALAKFDSSIKFVITDWNMPNMSGVDLLRQIRSANTDMPFLLVTGRCDADSVLEAKTAGVSAYIRKPFSLNQLEAKLRIVHQKALSAGG
jgi:two-component system chemotaxis response regulator CheY